MVILYTMPGCGICHMIKTRLEEKNIQFKEDDVFKVAEQLDIDRAPVLQINSEHFITSPSEMIAWISTQ